VDQVRLRTEQQSIDGAVVVAVTFLDSTGINTLLRAHHELVARGAGSRSPQPSCRSCGPWNSPAWTR
jgi:hypothetical protein